jgi:lipopolysaccharide transport protein LptA
VTLAGPDAKTATLRQFELFDNVHIVSTESGQATNIDAGYALYDKEGDRYELRNGSHVATAVKGQTTAMNAATAIFEQTAHKAAMTGSAEITQNGSYVKGDSISADLFPDNRIRSAVARGNASGRRSTTERTTTITAPELNISYNEEREMQDANAVGQTTVGIVSNDGGDRSNIVATAVHGIGVAFKGNGLIDKMRSDGRTTIQLNSPGGAPDAANKRVTADVVKTTFAANGKDLGHAEAIGNAELYIEPLQAAAGNYRTTVNAPRFDCEFYAGNNVRSCHGGKKTRTVRTPTVPEQARGPQTLLADTLTATFAEASRDVERLEAAGSAKFTELERTVISSQMTYTRGDETVRLRGGEPTTWDGASRARAKEIDWNTREQRSYLRGSVSTTYYNRKTMGDAAPLASSDRPVFITADSAEFDHKAETGLYSGNARGWQEDNFVRGDRILVRQREGQLAAEGSVQSGLYNARLRRNSSGPGVPVFASAESLNYDRNERILRYRGKVDIRQGTDRLTAAAADVFLNESNELSRTVAENGVVITQPGRRAAGDWVQYTAENETAVLRGDPASVFDAENGSSQGSELIFDMRAHRVNNLGRTNRDQKARTRSVYKIRPAQ